MKRSILAVCCAAVLGTQAPAGSATTFFVSVNGNDTANCGPSNTPCRTVQFALDKAVDGDTVRVRNGTYHECVFVSALVGVGAIILESESFTQNGSMTGAILDGDTMCGPQSNFPGPVAVVEEKSVVRGFTIRNGGDAGMWGFGAVQITNNIVTGNSTQTGAGGVFAYTGDYLVDDTAKLEIKTNTITSNTALFDGGAILVVGTSLGHPSVAEIQGNTLRTNVIGPDPDVASRGSFGGAIAVFTDAIADTETSVVITNNTITGNTAHVADNGAVAYGGGIFVATGIYGGYGKETVTIGSVGAGNVISDNDSEGYGGGMSVFLQPGLGGEHTLSIAGNTVSANNATLGGGGIHANFFMDDPDNGGKGILDITDNPIAGNHVTELFSTPGAIGGGGIFAEMYVNRTPASRAHFAITGNQLTANGSKSLGGGASLFASASDDPEGNGATAPAEALLEFKNNLVAENGAQSGTVVPPFGRGGGAWAFARAFGDTAKATVDQEFLTVSGNLVDAGAAVGGGLEWEVLSLDNSLGTFGKVGHRLSNSIVNNNDGFGVGGSAVPGGDVTLDISYTDGFGNHGPPSGTENWKPELGVVVGANGIVDLDPELDTLYLPPLCSPTIDLGDPLSDFSTEPEPNGGRVNLGHTGGSSLAATTFPDANGDGTVDGRDIVKLGLAFGVLTAADARYDASVDIDRNGAIDGTDLSFLAAAYAHSCP